MMMMIVDSIHQRFDRHGHELHSMCCYQCELVCVDVRDPPPPPQHHRHYPARSVLHLNQSLSLMQMMVMTRIVVDVYPSPADRLSHASSSSEGERAKYKLKKQPASAASLFEPIQQKSLSHNNKPKRAIYSRVHGALRFAHYPH